MPSRPYIVTAEMASIFPARAHRSCGTVHRRFPRDVRSESLASRPSGEMDSTSFPRERDGVREQELRSEWVVRYLSGQSDSPSIPRERDGVPERDVWTRWIARHPSGESASIRTLSSKSERLILMRSFTNSLAQQTASCNPLPAAVFATFYYSMNSNPVVAFRPSW